MLNAGGAKGEQGMTKITECCQMTFVLTGERKMIHKSVCMDCSCREQGCHGKCEKYLAEREKREKSKEDMLRQKAEDKAVRDVLYSDVPDAGKKEIRRRIARLSKHI